LLPRKVNVNSFEPSYSQLMHIIREQVASGELRPGDRLPTEAMMCKFHGISPMTVHRAITLLTQVGTLEAKRGKGIFVKPMQLWEAAFKLGQLQYLFSENSDTQVKILGLRIVPANAVAAEKMKIAKGTKVIFIRRLILAQGKPFVYHQEYLAYDPKYPIIESQMETTSIRGLFEGKGNHSFKKSSLLISSVNLQDEEAQLLTAPVNAAAFKLEHIFYDYDNRPVSWGWFICPGDRLSFSTVTGINDEGEK
jgi:DNA-binding GntR family transcriptional regulator